MQTNLQASAMGVAEAFSVLGVSPAADESTLRSAYREALLATHPDKGGDNARFNEVREAFDAIQRSNSALARSALPLKLPDEWTNDTYGDEGTGFFKRMLIGKDDSINIHDHFGGIEYNPFNFLVDVCCGKLIHFNAQHRYSLCKLNSVIKLVDSIVHHIDMSAQQAFQCGDLFGSKLPLTAFGEFAESMVEINFSCQKRLGKACLEIINAEGVIDRLLKDGHIVRDEDFECYRTKAVSMMDIERLIFNVMITVGVDPRKLTKKVTEDVTKLVGKEWKVEMEKAVGLSKEFKRGLWTAAERACGVRIDRSLFRELYTTKRIKVSKKLRLSFMSSEIRVIINSDKADGDRVDCLVGDPAEARVMKNNGYLFKAADRVYKDSTYVKNKKRAAEEELHRVEATSEIAAHMVKRAHNMRLWGDFQKENPLEVNLKLPVERDANMMDKLKKQFELIEDFCADDSCVGEYPVFAYANPLHALFQVLYGSLVRFTITDPLLLHRFLGMCIGLSLATPTAPDGWGHWMFLLQACAPPEAKTRLSAFDAWLKKPDSSLASEFQALARIRDCVVSRVSLSWSNTDEHPIFTGLGFGFVEAHTLAETVFDLDALKNKQFSTLGELVQIGLKEGSLPPSEREELEIPVCLSERIKLVYHARAALHAAMQKLCESHSYWELDENTIYEDMQERCWIPPSKVFANFSVVCSNNTISGSRNTEFVSESSRLLRANYRESIFDALLDRRDFNLQQLPYDCEDTDGESDDMESDMNSDDMDSEEQPKYAQSEEEPEDAQTEEQPEDAQTEEQPDDAQTEEQPEDAQTEEQPDDAVEESEDAVEESEEHPEETGGWVGWRALDEA